ncbi:MAG: SNF2-related protein, partial [Thermoplasmatota archaeon]
MSAGQDGAALPVPGVYEADGKRVVCTGSHLGRLAELQPTFLQYAGGIWASASPSTDMRPVLSGGSTPAAAAAYLATCFVARPPTAGGTELRFGRLSYLPHQLRPLVAMSQTGSMRVLVADEVGTGKTMAAGYAIAEMILRKPSARILVVAPAGLLPKWRHELRQRFGIQAAQMNGEQLDTALSSEEGMVGLCSLDANRSTNRSELAPLDLVVVDEAHHLIGRSGNTRRRAFGRMLSEASAGVMLLTATPIQLEKRDFVRLLEILLPGETEDSLSHVVEAQEAWAAAWAAFHSGNDPRAILRYAFVCLEGIAATSQVAKLSWSRLHDLVAAPEITPEALWEAAPLNGFYTRTRKREVGLERERKVMTLAVAGSVEPVPFGPPDRRVKISEQGLLTEIDQLFSSAFSLNHRMILASSRAGAEAVLRAGAAGST